MTKCLFGPRALHPDRMLRAAKKGQGAYASIVELDIIEDKTDKLSKVEIWSGSPVPLASRSRIYLLHRVQETCNQTVMSGRISHSFVDLAVFCFRSGSIAFVAFRRVRFWCETGAVPLDADYPGFCVQEFRFQAGDPSSSRSALDPTSRHDEAAVERRSAIRRSGQVIAHCLDKCNRQVDEVLVERGSLRGHFCDDEFVCFIDEEVLTVDTQPECNVSFPEKIPLVAIMHWTIAKIGNQVAAGPGLRIAATQRVFDPTSADDKDSNSWTCGIRRSARTSRDSLHQNRVRRAYQARHALSRRNILNPLARG